MTEGAQAASLAGRVRRARKSRDWTQAELAEQAGVAPGTVTRIENAQPVRPGNLRSVLGALDLTLVNDLTEKDDADIELVCDLVEKVLRAVPAGEERRNVANDMIRYLTIGRN